MSMLYLRMMELRDEYFNELTNEHLREIKDELSEDTKYSSDELIKIMADWSDERNLRGIV